jgi:hypothetical protein
MLIKLLPSVLASAQLLPAIPFIDRVEIVPGAVGGWAAVLVLTLLMRAGRRTAAIVDISTGARIARYPFATRLALSLLSSSLVGGSVFALTQVPSAQGKAICGLICFVSVAAAVSLLLEVTRIRASWTMERVELDSPWTGKRMLEWNELTEVQFSKSMNWFVLRGRPGTVVRLSGLLGGLTELLSELREQAAPALLPQIDEAVSTWRMRKR